MTDTILATLPNGIALPLNKHNNKAGKPYWVFDFLGRVKAVNAARFGVGVDGTEGEPIPPTVEVTVPGGETITIMLTSQPATSYQGKTTVYDERRVGEGEVIIPGEHRPRAVKVTISRKHQGNPWNVRVLIPNSAGGTTAAGSLADLKAA